MSISLIASCLIILVILIVLPLIVSYKAEKAHSQNKDNQKMSEWEKIRIFGNKINNKNKKHK